MNLVILGIFSFNSIGIEGAILQSLSHGFVASGLFMTIGVVYERYHTRMVRYYGGLAHTMPLYVFIFLFFTFFFFLLICFFIFILIIILFFFFNLIFFYLLFIN